MTDYTEHGFLTGNWCWPLNIVDQIFFESGLRHLLIKYAGTPLPSFSKLIWRQYLFATKIVNYTDWILNCYDPFSVDCHYHIPPFQSDVVHQSVFELVHSEDRDELQRQLNWNSFLGPENSTIPIQVRRGITHVYLWGQEVLPEESSSMANVTYFVPLL